MKITIAILFSLLWCGCASSRHRRDNATVSESAAESAKKWYWQQQSPPVEESPHYRRLTITIPAHAEGGVQYEEQTRTILIAE